MKNIFDEVNTLDKKAYEKFFLSSEILMEHAAFGICKYIFKRIKNNKKILIICGPGNNGADGIALSRLLYGRYNVSLYLICDIKSEIGKIQLKRAKAIGVKIINKIPKKTDVVVDAIFGTGLNKSLPEDVVLLLEKVNSLKAFKIACDISTGINTLGQIEKNAFNANVTITMGGLKKSLFSDNVKDYVGKIKVVNLGICRKKYENNSNIKLLEKNDLILPFRNKKNTHKGNFGHLNVVMGSKEGASKLASSAAFAFGCALVTIISEKNVNLPFHIMQNSTLVNKCTAIAVGMGLGKISDNRFNILLNNKIKKVVDADLFYDKRILKLLAQDVVLTPHPKEFVSLLEITGIANITVDILQNSRFYYVEKFCKKFPNVVLLLKGSNVLIGKNKNLFVNSLGSNILSKGGSGDVLSGMIGSLLAQGYNSLEASISASLAHTCAAKKYKKNNYSLEPMDLIKEIKQL